MVEKSAISAALRRRLFIVKIDVPQKSGKISKTILRVKVRKVRKIHYAADGISRYCGCSLGLTVTLAVVVIAAVLAVAVPVPVVINLQS